MALDAGKPEAAEIVAAECVVHAETKDHLNWELIGELALVVPTAELPHPIEGLLSIDHIAVPQGTKATGARVEAAHAGKRLSDHDAYVVDADL